MSTPLTFTVQSWVPINVTFDSTAPVPIPNDQIWVAVYGQLINNPGGGIVPAPGQSYYIMPPSSGSNPSLQLTSAAGSPGPGTADQVILPSATLTQWGSTLQMPIPENTSSNGVIQFTGRILISVGAPVQAQIANTNGSVGAPSASNPSDPSTGTFYDFIEFTVQYDSNSNSPEVDIDTSQVDSFGLPMLISLTDANNESYNSTFTGKATQGSNQIIVSGTSPGTSVQSLLVTADGVLSNPTYISTVSTTGKDTTITISDNAIQSQNDVTFTVVPAGPFGVNVARDIFFGDSSTAQSFQHFLSGIPASQQTNFSAGAPSGSQPPLRLTSPKDLSETANTNSFDTYFDSTIDAFFTKYQTNTFSIVSAASGSPETYSGTVTNTGQNGAYVLCLQNSSRSETYHIYYPFFTTNHLKGQNPALTPAAPPPWIQGTQAQEPASQMVWGCDGVFADNNAQTGGTFNVKVLGDIENSISAAFHRGIVLNDPSTWGDTSTWFNNSSGVNNNLYDYWTQYWHQANVTQYNLAYAFAYDDKFGASTNMQQVNVGNINIQLGAWSNSSSKALSTVSLVLPSSLAFQNQQINLTASVSDTTATGSITFYIDGTLFKDPANTQVTLGPQTLSGGTVSNVAAICPALPDGANTHTYIVTAVYSGDANHLPALAYGQLQLYGNSSIIIPAGTSVVPGSTLPSGSEVQLSIPGSDVNGNLVVTAYQWNPDFNPPSYQPMTNGQVTYPVSSENTISISAFSFPAQQFNAVNNVYMYQLGAAYTSGDGSVTIYPPVYLFTVDA